MKRTKGLLLFAALFLQAVAPVFSQKDDLLDSAVYFNAAVKRPIRKDNSAKIEALIKQMTVEEKVGQMTQLTIDMVTKGKD